MRRHIPNTITCLNLLFGAIAVVFALRGWLLFSVLLLLLCAIFDFCDGLAARVLKAYSPLGKELDSLADLISFGFAPAAMLYYEFDSILSTQYGTLSLSMELFSFFPFVVVVASALRLAKFNIDIRQNEAFIGLPTPANALLISALLLYYKSNTALDPWIQTHYTLPLLSLLLSWLMVSELPMFSLKIKSLRWAQNRVRFLFLGFSALYILVAFIFHWPWSLAVLLIMTSYILISLILWLLPHKCPNP